MSNKSEKNMADFEGEDMMSDEELAHINAHAASGAGTSFRGNGGGMQQHLAHMASMYRNKSPRGGWAAGKGSVIIIMIVKDFPKGCDFVDRKVMVE